MSSSLFVLQRTEEQAKPMAMEAFGSFRIHTSIYLPPLLLLLPLLFLFLSYPLNQNTVTTVPNIFFYSISNFHIKTIHQTLLASSSPPPTKSIVALQNAMPRKKKSILERIEGELASARAAIRKAVRSKNYTSNNYEEQSFIPRGSIYRNSFAFHQSHIEMEKRLKVWIYKEGEQPMAHDGPLNNIYGIEGQFIDEMESGKSHFMARHPDEAHLFLIPISVVKIVKVLYSPLITYSRDQLQRVVIDYIRVVADKYPYWNRSHGADHFLVSCHDWAPDISSVDVNSTYIFKKFIRVLCNANTSEGFKPHRDVSIPEINIPIGNLGPPLLSTPPEKRPILAFFAGGAHGYIRRILLEHWKGKDNEVQVHEYLGKKKDYFKLMGRSKFCLCPSGYEVASPRVVTAISVGCVPVVISDNYSLPFTDVLNWRKFSIHIPSKRIPEIKNILHGIPHNKYLKMQKRVTKVQKHFVINRPSKPFDMIHMVLHSVWLRRLNFRLPY